MNDRTHQLRRSRIKRCAAGVLVVAGLVVLVAALVVVRQSPLHRKELLAATLDGDHVIRAAKAYVRATGRAPNTADDLVPAYLEEMPRPRPGFGPWRVRRNDFGGVDPREFAVACEIEGAVRRWRTGYRALSCYVDPFGRQDWYATNARMLDSDDLFLGRSPE